MLDCIMLDIGGTFVKYSAVQDGVFAPPGLFPIAENGTAEEITATIIDHLKKHPAQKIAICMPGPADYRQGTMLMKHKFAAMYGLCLRDVLTLGHGPAVDGVGVEGPETAQNGSAALRDDDVIL